MLSLRPVGSSHTRSRWLRSAVVVLAGLLLVVVAGCSSDGDGDEDAVELDPLEQIKQATFAAGSARYEGEVVFAGGTSGPIEGTSQAEPPAGEVTLPVTTDAGPQEVQVVWVDGTIFVNRVVTTIRTEVSLTRRLAASEPWVRASYQPVTVTVIEAYDPFRLLEWLTARNNVARADGGTEQVGGEELARYVVDLTGQPITPGSAQTIEFLVDDEMRPRVVRLAGEDRIEYTISEFGVEVAPTPPPEDQIEVAGSEPTIVPTGPFEVLAEGTGSDGTTWQLSRAPGSDGYTCWRLDTPTPLDAVAATQPDGSSCVGALDPDLSLDQQVQVVVDSGDDAAFEALVVLVPAGTTAARLQFDDASTRDLVVDPQGFAVFVGPREPVPAVLEVTTAGGIVVTCGPGSVSSLEDLRDLPPEEMVRIGDLPWLCLEL